MNIKSTKTLLIQKIVDLLSELTEEQLDDCSSEIESVIAEAKEPYVSTMTLEELEEQAKMMDEWNKKVKENPSIQWQHK
jgi:phosphomevalonate kinase